MKINRLLITIVLSLYSFGNPVPQLDETDIVLLKDDVSLLIESLNKGDARTITNLTHELAYNALGGKEAFYNVTQKAIQQMQEAETNFLKVSIDDPSPVYRAGKYEVCFIPMTSLIQIKTYKLENVGFMVGIKNIGNQVWKYIDGASLAKDLKLLNKLLPGLDPNIALPPTSVKAVE